MLIPGALLALLAWDLTDFDARLRLASPQDDRAGMQRRHFARLGMAAAAGLLLSIASLIVQIRFSFEVAAVLVLFGVWGIGRLIRQLLLHE